MKSGDRVGYVDDMLMERISGTLQADNVKDRNKK